MGKGGAVNVRVDMRKFVGAIRYECEGMVIHSVEEPGVKEAINTEIYSVIEDDVPVDTGALQDSPYTHGDTIFKGSSSRYQNAVLKAGKKGRMSKSKPDMHYAHGDITDEGILFDPIQIREKKDGTKSVTHYARYVKGFSPYMSILENEEDVYNRIRDIIVEDINDEYDY